MGELIIERDPFRIVQTAPPYVVHNRHVPRVTIERLVGRDALDGKRWERVCFQDLDDGDVLFLAEMFRDAGAIEMRDRIVKSLQSRATEGFEDCAELADIYKPWQR